VLEQIERYKHLRARIGKSSAASSASECGENKDKKSKGGTTANQAPVTKTRCFICKSEHHKAKDCPRGNQRAIDAGREAAPSAGSGSGQRSKGNKQQSQSENSDEDGDNTCHWQNQTVPYL